MLSLFALSVPTDWFRFTSRFWHMAWQGLLPSWRWHCPKQPGNWHCRSVWNPSPGCVAVHNSFTHLVLSPHPLVCTARCLRNKVAQAGSESTELAHDDPNWTVQQRQDLRRDQPCPCPCLCSWWDGWAQLPAQPGCACYAWLAGERWVLALGLLAVGLPGCCMRPVGACGGPLPGSTTCPALAGHAAGSRLDAHPPTLTFLKNCSSARYTSHTASQVARVTVMCFRLTSREVPVSQPLCSQCGMSTQASYSVTLLQPLNRNRVSLQARRRMAQDAVYHFYGTAIEDELDNGSARHKPVQDLAVVRNAPVWAQEPTDEQGRKAGRSAGYFNTVGSKEGWQPTAFRSSRGARAAAPTQAVEDYLDEDEKEERVKVTLQVQPEYDTFGASAAEAARSFAQQEAVARPSLIPGGVMEELVVPVTSSVGVRLLQKMGWRPGRGVGAAAPSQNPASLPSAAESGPGSAGHVPATAAQHGIAAVAGRGSRWGSVAGVSLDNTPIYVLEPKQDQHGLGYDPFAGAEDFRAAKRQRQEYMEDYVEEEGPAPSRQALLTGRLGSFNYELGDSDEDDDAGFGRRRPLLLEPGAAPSAPLMLQSAEQLRRGGDYIPGFTKSQQQVVTAVYPAAQVPADWREQHVLPPRLGRGQLSAVDAHDAAPVREAAPPADPNLHREIDSLAAFVARSGPAVEALARKQARLATVAPRGRAEDANIHDESHEVADSSDAPTTTTTRAKFAFLLGGEGCEYYAWRLHKIRAALSAVTQRCGSAAGQSGSRAAVHGGAGAERDARPSRKSGPLSVEQRMALLGEAPLPSSTAAAQALAEATDLAHGRRTEGGGGAGRPGAGPGQDTAETAVVKAVAEGDRARLQEAMSSMFVKGESQDMTMEGSTQVGLRPAAALSASTTHPGGGMLSGAAAAAMAAFGSRFTSGTSEATRQVAPDQGGLMAAGGLQSRQALQQAEQAAMRPRRSAEDWRPEPLVCKRFNVPDPYKGQPQEAPGARPRIEQLALMHTAPGVQHGVPAAASGVHLHAARAQAAAIAS
ncbi:G-patch domain-containing protein, partial [Haematococcus lacustris]